MKRTMILSALVLGLLLLPFGLCQTTQPVGETRTTASGLKIVEVKKLSEPLLAQTGDTVWVHYTGRLVGGATPFDSSRGPGGGGPFVFLLGVGRVIPGWDEGIAGMKVGEKRQLIIPPNLAYGAEGRLPRIPPNATLEFDVELIGIERGDQPAR